jgi:hypothetical protein
VISVAEKLAVMEVEVFGLKEVLGNLDSNHEKLQEAVARQGDELAKTRSWATASSNWKKGICCFAPRAKG